MARTHSMSGTRFAGSNISAKAYTSHLTEHSSPGLFPFDPQSTDARFAELMETLRLHINYLQRLPWSVQTRRRLLCNFWELELRLKEMRLLLDPAVLQPLQQAYLKQQTQSP